MATDFRHIKKNCRECGAALVIRNTRDITRRNYCSHACRQKWRFKNGEFHWIARMQEAARGPNPAKGRKGSDHHGWIADRTKLKKRPIHENAPWRKAVFERDDYTCQECGQLGGRLVADHIVPYCASVELRWVLSNGRTLCFECHKQTPTYGAKARKYIAIFKP